MNKLHLAVLSTFLFAQVAEARVIYGADNRKEVSEASSLQKKVARAAVTMIANSDISKPRFGKVDLEQDTLRDWLEESMGDAKARKEKLFSSKVLKAANAGVTFCEGERFVDQPNPGVCSGVLIADDLILTAGHCVEVEDFCDGYKWVFGFEVNPKNKKAGKDIPVSDIYSCKKVVSGLLSNTLKHDYAIVQLDRPVENREPIEIRNDGNIDIGTDIFVVGSPSGLPLKVADGARVRDNKHPFYFIANTDTFQGNSGSGVFNAKTGVVEGLLVRGEDDFVPNNGKMCIEANRCSDKGCRGEGITRLTAIPEIGAQAVLNRASETEDLQTLNEVLKINFWVDFYSKDRETALIKAAKTGKARSMRILIAKGANVDHQDANGNTAMHYLAKVLSKDNVAALNQLIESKAQSGIKNKEGKTALELAKSINPEGAKILQQNGIK